MGPWLLSCGSPVTVQPLRTTLICPPASALVIAPPQTSNSSHTEQVISWILLPCLDCFATLGENEGPLLRVHGPSAYPLVYLVYCDCFRVMCWGNVCLTTWMPAAREVWCLPSRISTVPKKQKVLNRHCCVESFSELLPFSPQPPLPLLTPVFSVGEILKPSPPKTECPPSETLFLFSSCPCSPQDWGALKKRGTETEQDPVGGFLGTSPSLSHASGLAFSCVPKNGLKRLMIRTTESQAS